MASYNGGGDARQTVSGPATGLMVVGILYLTLSSLGLVLNLMGVSLMASGQGPKGPEESNMMAQAAGGVVGAIIGLVFGGLILFGSLKMKSLESYGLAMTASIMAMLPCHLCCLVGLPIGIWSLVVLNKPEVKSSFRG